LDLNGTPPGVYLVKINIGLSQFTSRFIIQ